MDNLLLMSLYVASNIQVLFLTSLAFGFGINICMTAKSIYSFVRVFRGQRGIRVRLPRYSVCYLRGGLHRHPRKM